MMLRYEIDKNALPLFNSSKMEKFCENAIKQISSDKDFNRLLKSVINKINSLEVENSSLMSQRDQLLRDKCEEESKNRKLQVEISQLNRDINGLK